MLPVFFVERISGLRKGELAALLWSNLEVERKALLVSKWGVQGGGIEVARPKTATYARKISIPKKRWICWCRSRRRRRWAVL